MTALRRCIVGALAVACLMAGAPALAGTYYFCYLHDAYSERGFYITPILSTSIEDLDETWTGFKFSEYASASGLSMDAGSVKTGCVSSSESPDYLRSDHSYYLREYPGMRQVDWPEPPVPSEPVEESAPTDSLVIEENESLTVPPEELAALALAEERKRAADLAKVVAENARRDAELDAKLQEAIRRAKRRGRMQ